MMDVQELLSVDELGAVLGLHGDTVRKWLRLNWISYTPRYPRRFHIHDVRRFFRPVVGEQVLVKTGKGTWYRCEALAVGPKHTLLLTNAGDITTAKVRQTPLPLVPAA